MNIKEEQRDLFTAPQGYYLAHCISGDYALGAGIAKQFVDVYNRDINYIVSIQFQKEKNTIM